jgi:phospholipase C
MRVQHVIWIWMENEAFQSIIGSGSAPYLTQLAGSCGLATNYEAVSHPSLPNYLAATSGNTWGVADDAAPTAHPIGHASIFSQLGAAGMTWRSYDESMPSTCDLNSSGEYAVKHNPAAYYTGIRAECRKWDVPFGAFASDVRRNRLPSFAFVTPNLCDDMHDCPIQVGDNWLHHVVPTILASQPYQSGSTVLFITFDEGTDVTNRVATIVVSPTTARGTKSARHFDHYSLLKTAEQLLGLAYLAHARGALSMRAAFNL